MSSRTGGPRSCSRSGQRHPATPSSSPARATSRDRRSRGGGRSRSMIARWPRRSCEGFAAGPGYDARGPGPYGGREVIELSGDRIAAEAGAEVSVAGTGGGAGRGVVGAGGRPERAVVDSRELRTGDLFFGPPGKHADGGEFAARALEAGAWGVVVEPE